MWGPQDPTQPRTVRGEEGPFWRIYKSDGNAGSKYVWIAFFEAALAAELITRCMFLDLRLGEKKGMQKRPCPNRGNFWISMERVVRCELGWKTNILWYYTTENQSFFSLSKRCLASCSSDWNCSFWLSFSMSFSSFVRSLPICVLVQSERLVTCLSCARSL